MANNNGHHSFYREQQKSILGQEKWTPKRIGKLLFTMMKWFLWGFLIIATLWGCVNEFIIQTSKNLGQGVEFYQADDFVYPNTYQAVNFTGYTSSKVAVEEGKIDREDDVIDLESVDSPNKKDSETVSDYAQTNPFNFIVTNPYVGQDVNEDDVPVWANTEDLFVNIIEFAEMGGDVSVLYYNLNLLSFSFITNAISHDANEMTYDGAWTSQLTLTTDFKEYVNSNIDSELYEVQTITDFYFYMIDTNDSDGLNNSVDSSSPAGIENINWKEDALEDGETAYTIEDASSLVGKLTPATMDITIDNFNDLSKWNVVKDFDVTYDEEATADEVLSAIQDQVKQETNLLAFNNGSGIQNSADYLAMETNDGLTIGELYLAEYNEQTGSSETDISFIDPVYNVDYNQSFLNTTPTFYKGTTTPEINIYGGAQTIIVPIEKGFPVRIDEESQELIDTWRGENFQNWNTSETEHQESGFDIENQMYGWTVLDSTTSTEENGYQASVMRVYDSAEEAIAGDVELTEENAFYADQRRLGWGMINTEDASASLGNGEFTNANDGNSYSVFDEKIKSWMNDDKYVRMDSTASINGEEVTYTYATEFAGMESLTQATYGMSGENPDYFYGTTPEIENNSNYKGQELTQEGSILSDSVIPTLQDSWGESRVTFIGWADWGKAWDVQYGPLYGAFVFPLAQLAMIIGTWFEFLAAWGVIFSIIVIVFLTRGLGALLSLKGTSNQMKMQEVQTDVAKIKAKYSKYDLKAEPRYKQKQQQEIMALYRKKEINPMGSLGTIFITMPIFISLWIIISSLPAYKVVFMGNFSWAVSSFYGIFNAGWLFMLYLLVGISVGLVQGVSSKLPTWLSNKRKGIKRVDEATKEAAKKQNKTQNIMIGVFVFMGLTVPALFAFYWICSGFFTIILELIKHSWKVHVAEEMKKDPTYKTPYARMFKKA